MILFISSPLHVVAQETIQTPHNPVIIPPEKELTLKEYSKMLVIEMWGEHEWYAFDRIIQKESSWTHSGAHNGGSTAYGLGGFLDGTWRTVGCIKTSDTREQIRCTTLYIKQRYGTPSNAYNHHKIKNWY